MSCPREHFATYGATALDLAQFRRETPFLRAEEHRRIDRAYETYQRLSADEPQSGVDRDLYEDCCELIYRVAHFHNEDSGDFGREDLADQVRELLNRIEHEGETP
jgi:hypothetical protein